MLKNFRTFQSATELHDGCKEVKLPAYVRDQLLRASLSVCLNLSEGSAKPSHKDRLRFYNLAFGSFREVQAIIQIEREALGALTALADTLGAHLYRLCRP